MENSSRPASTDDVAIRYQELRDAHASMLARLNAQRQQWGYGLAACVAATFWLVERSRHGGAAWPFLLLFLAFGLLLAKQMQLSGLASRAQRLLVWYDRNLQRVRGEAVQSGNTGESLRPAAHLYDRDLNLLGHDSLFGLLDTVRTGIGQRGLAQYLLDTADHQTSVERQAAVRELTPQVALREQIALLGASRFQQVDARFFDLWLEDKGTGLEGKGTGLEDDAPRFHPIFRPLLALTSAALVTLLLLGLLHVREWSALLPNLLLAVAVQGGVCLYLQRRVRPILEATNRLSNHVRMFAEGLAVLERAPFDAALLHRLQAAARQPADAVKQLNRLESLVMLAQQRTKEIFYVFSILFAAGTQAAISLAAWKHRYGAAMRGWLLAWAEFEALNALAGYAYEHPADAWPELLPDTAAPTFAATGLRHPLLPAAVANDVSLGDATRFYLISGSNMSGKSTLMRSIGINAVLAYAGAPVRAGSLRLSPLRLGASLALTDSLAEGKSKFLAEVERLQQVVAVAAGEPVLFLVDEIFSGTNSADRQMAAHAVLSRLLAHGAIGALSTHDLALTGLAQPETGGENVHMASPDPDDPLAFDYRLKPGVNTQSNALAIIRMMGLEP